MKQNRIEEPQVMSLKHLILGIGAVSIIVLILVYGAILYNGNRRQKIVSAYSNETIDFVNARKDLFKQLFTSVIGECQDFADEENNRVKLNSYYRPSDLCPRAQQVLSDIGVESLKDSQSAAYLVVRGHNVILIEASGKYHPPAPLADQYIYSRGRWGENTHLELNEYLTKGKQLSGYWKDFIGYIPGKEVLVPIDIDEVRVGYIFRGVIER